MSAALIEDHSWYWLPTNRWFGSQRDAQGMLCRTITLTWLLGVCSLTPRALSADKPADRAVERGHRIALHICTACHVVEATQEYPVLLDPPAPPFNEIAHRPDLTRASLRHFILTTHWDQETLPLTMPNPQLLDDQVNDVVAYILSLPTR
jgi:mono/diheme cytochrome c family protein